MELVPMLQSIHYSNFSDSVSLLSLWFGYCSQLKGLSADVSCVHLGCRLRASGKCLIPCTHPLPKSPLRASVKMAFLVARIGAQKDHCVHLFQKWPLHASVWKSLKTKIWIRTSESFVFTTAIGFQYSTLDYEGVYNRQEPFLVQPEP